MSIEVKNTGRRSGQEVVQMYIHNKTSRLPCPSQELKRFQKISLRPGESKTVDFELDNEDFSYFDPSQNRWVSEPGEFELRVGSSSRDIRAREILVLK